MSRRDGLEGRHAGQGLLLDVLLVAAPIRAIDRSRVNFIPEREFENNRPAFAVSTVSFRRIAMSSKVDDGSKGQFNRRTLLRCAAWGGAGVVWALKGGVPRSFGLIDAAAAAE